MSRKRTPKRGLVLGAGGVLGAAWAVGALCALEEVHGFDPRDAEVIIGTSAGSVLAALLGGGVSARQLRDHQLGIPVSDGPLAGFSWDYEKATTQRPGVPRWFGPGSGKLLRSSARRLRQMPPTAVLSGFLPQGSGSLDRIGHLVEAITPMGEWSPHENVWICAMNYQTGTRTAFGRAGAPTAELAQAVMASCAIPAWFKPVTIGDEQYVDGGACSATSVDLLATAGLDEVYVIAPMVSFAMDRPEHMIAKLERRWRVQVTKRCLREVEKVRANGSDVVVLGPGPEDLEAIGANLMDVSRRINVLETSLRTSIDALRDPDHVGPDHLAEVG
ncbi:MAG: patatin-like phospholipase family protein [Candidatus Nanopelagicales bacterium]